MNRVVRCPIWDTPAIEHSLDGVGRAIESLRTAGMYFVSWAACTVLLDCAPRVRARLTSWLIEQRRLGVEIPEIHEDTIEKFIERRDMDISERADNILKYLAVQSDTLGAPVKYQVFTRLGWELSQHDLDIAYFELLAHSESLGEQDFNFLLLYLEECGQIKYIRVNDLDEECTLTVSGYARLAELEQTYTASSRAFVAMWFDDSMKAAWEQGFSPAICAAGYEPVRIDQKEHVNKIDDEIIAEIRRARFVVADFTHGETGTRGGVYYEAGYAHGLGIPVIFTCRKDVLEEIHFDTRQYNHIVWTDTDGLQRNLSTRISAVIGDGPKKPPA